MMELPFYDASEYWPDDCPEPRVIQAFEMMDSPLRQRDLFTRREIYMGRPALDGMYMPSAFNGKAEYITSRDQAIDMGLHVVHVNGVDVDFSDKEVEAFVKEWNSLRS